VKLSIPEMRADRSNSLLSLILVILGFISCDKVTVTNQATADVFIKSIAYQGDTLFGVAHSVFSYNGISQVSVKTPQGDTLLLPSEVDKGLSFYKDPSFSSGDFNTTPPASGLYSYRVTFKDKTQTVLTNTLGANFLLPAKIDSFGRSADGQFIVVKWNAVNEAQGYQIRIVKGNTEVIPPKIYYQLSPLRVQFPVTSFVSNLPGTFRVELDALLFESAAHQLLQALSVSKDSVQLQ
jgi:hypothetical protein